jgi:hypothetical protein
VSSEALDGAQYEPLFGRSRRKWREAPNPTLYLDVCGYEYSMVTPDMLFTCRGCGRAARAVLGVTGRAHVSVADASQAFGCRHVPLGVVCDMNCADLAMKEHFNQ